MPEMQKDEMKFVKYIRVTTLVSEISCVVDHAKLPILASSGSFTF